MDQPSLQSDTAPPVPAHRLPAWVWCCTMGTCAAFRSRRGALVYRLSRNWRHGACRLAWTIPAGNRTCVSGNLAGRTPQANGLCAASPAQALLPQIRANEAPIDELSKISGRLTPLRSSGAGDPCAYLREQQGELNHEMRQRVASRTSVLERKIGSLRHQASRRPDGPLQPPGRLTKWLDQMISRWRTSGEAMSLLMMDLDHFKTLNDTLGHAAGDELLRSVAQIIRSTIRRYRSRVSRWGGDEFAILCEATDAVPLSGWQTD